MDPYQPSPVQQPVEQEPQQPHQPPSQIPQPSLPVYYASAPDAPSLNKPIIEAMDNNNLNVNANANANGMKANMVNVEEEDENSIDLSLKQGISNKFETNNSDDEGYGRSTFGVRLNYNETSNLYQDKLFTFLFLFHLILMFVFLVLQWRSNNAIKNYANIDFFIIFTCAVIGAVMGYVWTKVLRKYSAQIIRMMLWGNMIFMSISMLYNFIFGSLFYALLLFFSIIFFGLYIWSIWKRIPFSEVLIEIACKIMDMYEGTVVVALGVLVLQIIWILWWSAIAVAYMSQKSSNINYGIIFLLLISFYWNLETFKNIGHVTVCGIAATWYFSPYPHNPTKKSLKRALTTSLGSIALGSFIVAFIQALRHIVRLVRNKTNHDIMLCILDCLLNCLDRMVQYFNMYAFAHIAIYGTSYIDAAKQTFDLLKSKGIDALINDDLTGFAILCGALIGGLICGIFGAIMATLFSATLPDTITFFAFLVGFYLCLTVLHIIGSCVVTLFICYAEDPHCMSIYHSNEYHKFEAAKTNLGHVPTNDDDI